MDRRSQVQRKYDDDNDEFFDMLSEFKDMWYGSLGLNNTVKQRMYLNSSDLQPLHSAPYHTGLRAHELDRNEMEKMVKMNIIEIAHTKCAAPIMFTWKSHGALHFCIAYPRPNAVIIRNFYPLPRMEECIHFLGDARVFSTLDPTSGYCHIETDREV